MEGIPYMGSKRKLAHRIVDVIFNRHNSENVSVSVSEFSKKIINWHELSRHLSGNGQNIRPNKIPKKYQKKINRFLKIIDILFGG